VSIASWPHGRDPHIPGARFLPIESIVIRDGWPPDELPPVDELRKAFEAAGVGDEGRIVLYSANPLYATRAWFTLDYLGHGNRTAILDGGFERWQSEKRPVAMRRIERAVTTLTVQADPTRVVSHSQMRLAYRSGKAVLIDARPVEQFIGSTRGRSVARGGHIPGALCNPWKANVTPDQTFRSPAELKSMYEPLLPAGDERVIVYCHTGMEASMPYFVLRSLGYDVALYDGSFVEWARDEAVPVATVKAAR
jgi:thiosulfate/3-mercaptopyruvate sulfurtransferase